MGVGVKAGAEFEDREEFRLIFGLQRHPLPYTSFMSINMRDAVPRDRDFSLYLGTYMVERMWKWCRVGLGAHKAVSSLFPAGLSQPLWCCDTLKQKRGCAHCVGRPLGSSIFLGECRNFPYAWKAFVSRGASLSSTCAIAVVLMDGPGHVREM